MKKVPAVFYTSLKIPVLAVAALLFTNMSIAEPIYKSTNAQGEVVFSDEPPPDAASVEQVEIAPAPTEAEHKEGVERAKRMESMADEMGAERKERVQQHAESAPKVTEEQSVETYADGDLNEEQRRRRAIAGERLDNPGVEHRAPAHAVPHAAPHAGGGGRR